MSDSTKGPVGQIAENIGEAVVKPLIDTAGDIAQEVISSIVPGTVVNLQQQQAADPSQMTEEEQKKIAETRWRIEQLKKIDEEQKIVREQTEQKEQARLQQQQEQEEQEEEQEDMQKQQSQNQAIADAQRHAEVKKGVGG